jgi:hypothetical protein
VAVCESVYRRGGERSGEKELESWAWAGDGHRLHPAQEGTLPACKSGGLQVWRPASLEACKRRHDRAQPLLPWIHAETGLEVPGQHPSRLLSWLHLRLRLQVPAAILICRNSTDTAYFQRLRPYPRVLLRRMSARFKDYDKT